MDVALRIDDHVEQATRRFGVGVVVVALVDQEVFDVEGPVSIGVRGLGSESGFRFAGCW